MAISGGAISEAPISATAESGASFVEVTVAEALTMAMTSTGEIVSPLEASFVMTEAATAEIDTVVREYLALGHTIVPGARMAATINDLLTLTDRHVLISQETITEVLELAEALQATPSSVVAIVDALVLSGQVENTLAAMAVVAEVLAFRDTLRSVQEGWIEDAASFVEVLEARVRAMEVLVSEAIFSDEVGGMATFVVMVNDSVQISDQVDPRVSLMAAIHEGLDFAVGFVFDDTPYLALSVNAATRAVTTYTNYEFTSLASFNGQTYATGEGGLYRLGGSDDAGTPIIWKLRTGLSNLGTNRNKGLDAAYLGYTASGAIHLKCIVVAPGGQKIAHWYELTPQGAASPRPGRIPTGRGLRSVYWGFELTNVDEGDVDLDTLELHPIVFEGRLP